MLNRRLPNQVAQLNAKRWSDESNFVKSNSAKSKLAKWNHVKSKSAKLNFAMLANPSLPKTIGKHPGAMGKIPTANLINVRPWPKNAARPSVPISNGPIAGPVSGRMQSPIIFLLHSSDKKAM